MSTGVPSDTAIRESAVRWCTRLEGEVGDAVREEFHRWLLADPRHEKEYLAAVSTTFAMSDIPRETGDALIAPQLPALPASFIAEPLPEPRRRPWRMALAASVLVASIAAGWVFLPQSGLMAEGYVTNTGEMRTVKFEDGSVAYMNTRTKLKWIGNLSERRVVLVEGEALFDVMHDESRPFHVVLDNSEIQVRGTRFNVYRKKSGEVVVTVLEGTVDVQELGQASARPAWKRELHAGERIVYRPIGLIRDVHPTDALDSVKWRDGVLRLANEPLEDVLDELTRYTDRRIVIRDPRIAKLTIGGALPTRDVRAALKRIEDLEPTIIVTEQGGQFTLSQRPEMN
jgi:transmembrane sensor